MDLTQVKTSRHSRETVVFVLLGHYMYMRTKFWDTTYLYMRTIFLGDGRFFGDGTCERFFHFFERFP